MSNRKPSFTGLRDKQPPQSQTPSAKLAPPSNDTATPSGSRASKKALTGYFHPQTIVTLKIICAMKGMTQEQAMSEAFDDFFRKHDQSPVGG